MFGVGYRIGWAGAVGDGTRKARTMTMAKKATIKWKNRDEKRYNKMRRGLGGRGGGAGRGG